jgi:LPXTG-motif cell wall-anchored protein
MAWHAHAEPGMPGSFFYGQGTMTVENTSNQRLTLYMPVGTLLPPATPGSQTMAAFSSNTQVTDQGRQEPQQLPQTGAGDGQAAWLMLIVALGLLAAGWRTVRQARRR